MVIEYKRIKERLENKETTDLSDKEIKMYLSQIDQYNKFAEEYFGKEEYNRLKGE